MGGSRQIRVYREDPADGSLKPCPQLTVNARVGLAELQQGLQHFLDSSGPDDRLLLDPKQVELIIRALKAPIMDESERSGLQQAARDAIAAAEQMRGQLDAAEADNALMERRLEQERELQAQPRIQSVELTLAEPDRSQTWRLGSSTEFDRSHLPPLTPREHALGAALLQVAVREWDGMAAPTAQAPASRPGGVLPC